MPSLASRLSPSYHDLTLLPTLLPYLTDILPSTLSPLDSGKQLKTHSRCIFSLFTHLGCRSGPRVGDIDHITSARDQTRSQIIFFLMHSLSRDILSPTRTSHPSSSPSVMTCYEDETTRRATEPPTMRIGVVIGGVGGIEHDGLRVTNLYCPSLSCSAPWPSRRGEGE